MISIHDNNVFAIDIRCEEKVIVLHTEFREGTLPECVDVVFSGVVAHRFDHVLDGNILLEITESQPGAFYEENSSYLREFQKYGLPIVTLIDTPGAYPGIGAEERGQAQAIAVNLMEMSRLRVPIICIVIGEGGSGGALGIGVGDKLAMLEYAYYSVISPEGFHPADPPGRLVLYRVDDPSHQTYVIDQSTQIPDAICRTEPIYAEYDPANQPKFYHNAKWFDMDGDGLKDAVTVRSGFKIRPFCFPFS